jgi:hypothetical protein
MSRLATWLIRTSWYRRRQIQATYSTARAVGLTMHQTNEVILAWKLHYAARQYPMNWAEVREAVKSRACDMDWRP